MNTATTTDAGIDGVAEDVAEDADPDDLVDQPADARAEEEEVDQGVRIELPDPNSQLPNSEATWSRLLGSWRLRIWEFGIA